MSSAEKLALAAGAGALVAAATTYFMMGGCKSKSVDNKAVTLGDSADAKSEVKASEQQLASKGPYLEYSVVYTDRAFNLMSPPFQQAMRDISASLKAAYNATSVAIIPGSGSYGMEAVARQFGTGQKCLVIRNGYFSYRWSDIFEVTKVLASPEVVLCARPVAGQETSECPQFAPVPIEEAVASIKAEKPAVVFAPHVETATGIVLPASYMTALAAATHEVGGLLVIDGIAAGTEWCDMAACGVDVYLSAPQKGWSGPACAGLVMMGPRARAALDDDDAQAQALAQQGTSFCCNLAQWTDVMEKYEAGGAPGGGPGFRYYTTLPTDALMTFRDVIQECEAFGLAACQQRSQQLGSEVRQLLADAGFKSTAGDGFGSSGVVVVYTPQGVSGSLVARFKAQGVQVAGGVPWKLGEGELAGAGGGALDTKACTFRVGLFGLDKLQDVAATVEAFKTALTGVLAQAKAEAAEAPAAEVADATEAEANAEAADTTAAAAGEEAAAAASAVAPAEEGTPAEEAVAPAEVAATAAETSEKDAAPSSAEGAESKA